MDELSTRSQRLTKTQPDPVRAYEAVTTDELSIRGQRPTKAQPNPVRAREAVTTDELFTRAPIEFTNIESYSIRRQIESNRIEDPNSNSGRIEQ